MGNAHTKEARDGPRPGRYDSASLAAGQHGESSERSGRRSSRRELSALELLTGSGSNSRTPQADAPFERRETKQEREARRLERERVARIKERERSMKEEHVDGGFLVTVGVYTASEDFSKPIVRQLQIERRIAPFWRGLDDFKDDWAEHQIIAAARGLDIPPADEVPENLVPQPRPAESPSTSLQNLSSLTVPMGPRTLSAASDKAGPGSNPASSLPSPTSPTPSRMSKPHKAIAAALSISSRNGSQQDIAPREVNLAHDPFVNGQPLEVFLYKDGDECPICCLYYPRYLNKTRCCDQFICSECFVQIKRPDPHLPEHHGDQSNELENPQNSEEQQGELIMEAACCPYCTQTDFGITYEPPPFRRGLTYSYNPPGLGSMGTAMSSSSSLSSGLSPTSATTPVPNSNRRRATSVSANDPSVITTDRIRPDWVTKLTAARAQQRRRAAAADALHHAAFVMGNNNDSSRSLFGRSSRFSRRQTGATGSESPGSTSNLGTGNQAPDSPVGGPELGNRSSSARTGPSRERIDAAHLESMMMAEAIRLSLADEEERRKKAEKEAKKEAKKKEKEERKANKRKSAVYGHSDGGSSASASTLSLGLGRRRGNSAAGSQSLRVEASVAAANATANQGGEAPSSTSGAAGSITGGTQDKGKGVDRGDGSALPIPISQPSRGSSHLRQISNASSISSSGIDSMPASYSRGGLDPEDPRTSGLSLGGGKSDDEGAGNEPMFNFNSLAQMVGVPIDGQAAAGDKSPKPGDSKDADSDKASEEHHEHVEHVMPTEINTSDHAPSISLPTDEKKESSTTLDISSPDIDSKPANHLTLDTSAGSSISEAKKILPGTTAQPPSVTVTPETPAPLSDGEEDSKQLGHSARVERPSEVTQ
ncbi:uncharacterized protein JN550_010627 [Neoarthrinium moseri]|uniref:uncharacterized protein n=1 Tax=Neoarthrinium moseri TaxID=1658444 RepID=UPI001FDBBE47|nr:uncharacterized protein JN550_010627 [Neoarthrinium moseri]KAI1861996.1 hypothetical protein JN550_010627 [Neoarthrinium moseri]